ncbi:MAG: rhomboid family intramembrane serine protease [Capsulimonadales bacterium]|nr:rhomboid family intramembrane serine protease [Capsulimonadales bacterium]
MIPLRDENPTRSVPYLTYLLIAVNVLLFLFQTFGGGMFETRSGLAGPLAGWTLIPAEVTRGIDHAINGPTLQPTFLTILTSMFLHGGWLHLAGNMLFLAIFGNNIEDALGSVKYLFFYVACGVAAAATQIFSMPNSLIPTLGASGAIAGVLGAYLVLFPRARVLTLVFLGFILTWIRVPAWVLLGFWIVSQFFSQWTQSLKAEMMGGETGGVAYFAHIGGFIAGMILIKVLGGQPPRTPYETYRPPQVDYRLIRR